MGSRIYVATINAVSISATQDIWSILAGTRAVEIHSVRVSCGGVTAAAELNFTMLSFPATVTQTSGGTSPTINPVDSGDTAASLVTLYANNTNLMTTSGTAKTVGSDYAQVLNYFPYLEPPEDRDLIHASEGWVLRVTSPPGGGTLISSTIKWREI